MGPGWRGLVQVLSTVLIVDWVLLGSGESNKGYNLGSFQVQRICRHTLGRYGVR